MALQAGDNGWVHPLRARRTHVVIALGCVASGIGGWVMARIDASETAQYVVLCAIVAIATIAAVAGAPRVGREDQAARSRRSSRGA